MNLVAFSIKTKGARNFIRRLWTVFTRFGFSESRTRHALYAVVNSLRQYSASPTFFIPAVVLKRHPMLIAEIAHQGAEIGIHGYIHNDYRFLSEGEQHKQTQRAISVFEDTHIPYRGFRNPYLGWTEESLRVFATLGFLYESNDAVLHDVIALNSLSPVLRSGYEKSLKLFQAIPCHAYTLRPHFEGNLLRLPTSIPDDEMLFDRLRITQAEEVGRIWGNMMQRVYDLGGLYTLNLHPERSLPCKRALDMLLSHARSRPLPVWVARLKDIAAWWKERKQFRCRITELAPGQWRIEVSCTPRATVLVRHLSIENQPTTPCFGNDRCIRARSFTVNTNTCPCIGVSGRTVQDVIDFLLEQGYPIIEGAQEDAHKYAHYVDMPGGMGGSRAEQMQKRSALVEKIERLEAPMIHFGCWPDGGRAALAVSGDIDSVTIQDFFLRILEVRQER
jgi:peptidoglycan/xylan/chitin deacetylase (PgdA/CDA1 family)